MSGNEKGKTLLNKAYLKQYLIVMGTGREKETQSEREKGRGDETEREKKNRLLFILKTLLSCLS